MMTTFWLVRERIEKISWEGSFHKGKTQFRVELISISELPMTHMCQEILFNGRVIEVQSH